jgi:hypothetical protein
VAEDGLPKDCRQKGERCKRERKEPGEQEAEDSGAKEEDEDEWSGSGSDAERKDDPLANNDDDGDQDDQHDTPPPPPSLRYPPNSLLQRVLDAMDTPQRNYCIRDLNTLSEYEFNCKKNIVKNKELLCTLIPQDAGAALGLSKPWRIPKPPCSSTSAASASAELLLPGVPGLACPCRCQHPNCLSLSGRRDRPWCKHGCLHSRDGFRRDRP